MMMIITIKIQNRIAIIEMKFWKSQRITAMIKVI